MNHPGFKLASTLTEVAMSKEVIIEDVQKLKIVKQGFYKDMKSEWTDETAFYKRLREMIELKLIYIKDNQKGKDCMYSRAKNNPSNVREYTVAAYDHEGSIAEIIFIGAMSIEEAVFFTDKKIKKSNICTYKVLQKS